MFDFGQFSSPVMTLSPSIPNVGKLIRKRGSTLLWHWWEVQIMQLSAHDHVWETSSQPHWVTTIKL